MTSTQDLPGPGTDEAAGFRWRRVAEGRGGDRVPGALGRVAELSRVTGLLLVPLLALHVTTLLLRDPAELDRVLFLDRWSSVGWLFADWGLLLVGSVHGVLALWPRLDGWGGAGRVLFGTIAVCTATLFFTASWVMLDYA